jgi:hypothetical protein
MAISSNDLNSEIKDALADYNNGAYPNEKDNPQHLKIIGDTMKDYFEKNTEITYGWSAALPPPASTPDPVTSFKSKVDFPNFDITPSTNLITMALLIQAAFVNAKIKHADGFSIPDGSFLAVMPPIFPPSTDAETALLNSIINPTCLWVLTIINPAPLAGTHGPYTGATTGMVIS